jgi:UDP-3-O-[3-hydroxymyristoyl] glucosamine N-acyltransferase
MKLSELASKLNVNLECSVEDAEKIEVSGAGAIHEAADGEITFVVNLRYAAAIETTKAAVVIIPVDFPTISKPALRSNNPYLTFAQAIKLLTTTPLYEPGIHSSAIIHPSAEIGSDAHVAAYVVIGEGVRIGKNAVLLPHVTIYKNVIIGDDFFAHSHAVIREFCQLGDRVILQNSAIIGADGFGFAPDEHGKRHKIPQVGVTVLHDDVEIQANACIDRATVGRTIIGSGTKIDNLVQVGHGCHIGKNSVLCAQVGLAGSTNVGDYVTLAGAVGVAGHCKIGDKAIVTAMSGVPGDVAPGAIVSGTPAMDNKLWRKSVAIAKNLPSLLAKIRHLEKKIKLFEEEFLSDR